MVECSPIMVLQLFGWPVNALAFHQWHTLLWIGQLAFWLLSNEEQIGHAFTNSKAYIPTPLYNPGNSVVGRSLMCQSVTLFMCVVLYYAVDNYSTWPTTTSWSYGESIQARDWVKGHPRCSPLHLTLVGRRGHPRVHLDWLESVLT